MQGEGVMLLETKTPLFCWRSRLPGLDWSLGLYRIGGKDQDAAVASTRSRNVQRSGSGRKLER